jgi:C1A family cysteine protease
MPPNFDASQLNALIQSANAGWVAGATSVSELPFDQQKSRLGYVPGAGEESLEQRLQASAAKAAALKATIAPAPTSFDWRNVGGKNFITPVRNQGGCASSVSFGTTATVESTFRIQRNNANLAVDLSEAHLFFCVGPATGASCTNGWSISPAVDACKMPGIADEASFPYTDREQPCNLLPDWENRVIKIAGWHTVSEPAELKNWLSTRGPLVTCFTVYGDFFAYTRGIYRHVSGDLVGGHCVSVVGYNDNDGFWICKNSWGTEWGEAGFFSIAYGDCGIDSTMWAVDGILETGWLNNTKVLGLWTVDQDRNAWAYFEGVGWRKIATDTDHIFIYMLTALVAAKEEGRPLNVYQDNGVIKQVYVL